MKLKEYFDVSSIHGLGHINSQRWFGKLFWIIVVFCGFVVAGILVQQSFEDWRDDVNHQDSQLSDANDDF